MTLPGPVSGVCATFLAEIDTRLPGRVTGLFLHGSICWGEFTASSDVDFVARWAELPADVELDLLEEAHLAVREQHPELDFDGFHCTDADLRTPPAVLQGRPVFFAGSFDRAGDLDINPVTWQELAERGIVLRGTLPEVHTDLDDLVAFTRHNLDTYWRSTLDRLRAAGPESVDDPAVTWVALGAARLHHLLATRSLTSKSGAGRYVVERLDPRWHPIAREALRVREHPDGSSLYADTESRGSDLVELLTWLVEDGVGLPY